MADGITGPVSQSSAVKPSLTMGAIVSYVIVVGAQDACPSENRRWVNKESGAEKDKGKRGEPLEYREVVSYRQTESEEQKRATTMIV
ncbi:hypothetical protein ElyMa_003633800 [Elysia marginata]|uniref:Uncharacterized protein n=1 Tax=Elysia marginata TaxID=1093978 RepID=A0AAV4EUB3_9GAST|nr:hypothetical protein ElyMa_003633800 [Elysia marginata]